MNILLFAGKPLCEKVISWTLSHGHNILGIIADNELAGLSEMYNVPFISETDKNFKTILLETDCAISWLYGKRITEPFISGTKYGCINFHPAPLPEYRGRGGCSLAILNGESKWGVTAHYVDETFDTGEIIEKKYFKFDYKDETGQSLKIKTNNMLFGLYKEIIGKIETYGKLESFPQKMEDGIYLSKKEMLGMMKIDIEKDDIDRKIQAFWFPPYTGAYIEINGKKYTLANDVVLNKI